MIRYSNPKSSAKEAMRLLGQISSYLFEQEFGELRNAPASDINALKQAQAALNNIINRNKK